MKTKIVLSTVIICTMLLQICGCAKQTDSNVSDALNVFYDFPDWYEKDKVVVHDNMVCLARDYWDYDQGKAPAIWLFVFDESGHFICEYEWGYFNDEENAQKCYNNIIDDKPNLESYQQYYDKDVMAFKSIMTSIEGQPEGDITQIYWDKNVIAIKNWNRGIRPVVEKFDLTYEEITMQVVIEGISTKKDGTQKYEVIYK